jgi:nucleoside-diphosphate-sugar epimerase
MTLAPGSTILLTGITGFLAKHVALELLKAGFNVRGTLRNMAKADEVRAVAASAGFDPGRVSFAVADLVSDAGWGDAMHGCSALVHTASPFLIDPTNDKTTYVAPARDGTIRVLEAAYAAGIRRAVVTSSVAAIQEGHASRQGRVFTEADWTDAANAEVSAYPVSKTLAEQAAWQFAKSHDGFALTTINPGLILGPLLDRDAGTSADIIGMFLAGKYPGVPDLLFSIVDVRDVASAHVRALMIDASIGERIICTGEPLTMMEISSALRSAVPERARKLPKFILPKFILRIAALFDPAIRLTLPDVGVRFTHDNSKSKRILGITYRDSREAVGTMGRSLIELGLA